ncbi:MAG: hypothetical protein U1B80_01115 [Anaerolineaceae bacterium]|nr:hypothetical protein [Anaerolineaceae bacterium]
MQSKIDELAGILTPSSGAVDNTGVISFSTIQIVVDVLKPE